MALRKNLITKPSFEAGLEGYEYANVHASVVSGGNSGTKALRLTTAPAAARWFDSKMIVRNPSDPYYVAQGIPAPIKGGVFRNVNQFGNLRNGQLNTPDSAETLITAIQFGRLDVAADIADFLIGSMYTKAVWGQNISFIAEGWTPENNVYVMLDGESHSRTLALAAYALSEYSKIDNTAIRGITPRQAAIDLLFAVRRLQLVVADRIAGSELPSWMSGGVNEWWRNLGTTMSPEWAMHSLFAQDVIELSCTSLLASGAAGVTTSAGIAYNVQTTRNNYRTFMNAALGQAGCHMPVGLPHQRISAPGNGTFTFINWYTPGEIAPNPMGTNADWTSDAMGWFARGRALSGATLATYMPIIKGLKAGNTLYDAYTATGQRATDGGLSEEVPQAPALMYLATNETNTVPTDTTWLDYVKITQLSTADARDGSWSWTGHFPDHAESIATAVALRALGTGWSPRINGRPNFSKQITVQPGTQYTASVYYKTTGTLSNGFSILVEAYDNENNWTWLNEYSSSSTATATSWTRKTVTFTTPANCNFIILYPAFNSSASPSAAVTLDVDSIMLEEGAGGDYFDGDSAGFKWDGVPYASTSSEMAPVTNLFVSPVGIHTVRDLPVANWVLDGPSPFYDYSGHGAVATASGFTRHPSLVTGASQALVVSKTNKLTTNPPIYGKNFESLPFTLEVTFRSIKREPTSVARQQVWGHSGAYDGIVIAGTEVSFSTKYANTGEAKCSYDVGFNQTIVAAAVHTKAKNSLYINGELVAEVGITEEQQADTYAAGAGASFTSGDTTGENLLALNSIVAHRNTLTAGRIRARYNEFRGGNDYRDIVSIQHGALLSLSSETSNPEETVVFNTTESFSRGYFVASSAVENEVIPETSDGLSVKGYWDVAVVLPRYLTSLYGVTLRWEGEGVGIETSLDGKNWSPAAYGVKIETVPHGTNPSDKILIIRATFEEGHPPDYCYLQSLVVDIFGDNELIPVAGRTVTISKASVEDEHSLKAYHENWGIALDAGSLTIAAAPAGAPPVKTIEVWAKKGGNVGFSDNLVNATPSSTRSNGGTLSPYQIDEWQLRTYVFNNGFSGQIEFTGTGQIGAVVLYPHAMTTAQSLQSYNRYMGCDQTRLDSAGILSINDSTNYVEIYEYEWEIVEAE